MGSSETLNIPKLVKEYLSQFHKVYLIEKPIDPELEKWCLNNLGKQYRDWLLHRGGKYDQHSHLHIKNPKHCLVFEIMWSSAIFRVDIVNN
jgi:hypothetical protein